MNVLVRNRSSAYQMPFASVGPVVREVLGSTKVMILVGLGNWCGVTLRRNIFEDATAFKTSRCRTTSQYGVSIQNGRTRAIRGSGEHLAGRSRIKEPITKSNRLVQSFHLEWKREVVPGADDTLLCLVGWLPTSVMGRVRFVEGEAEVDILICLIRSGRGRFRGWGLSNFRCGFLRIVL
jgi:hypothetical protein